MYCLSSDGGNSSIRYMNKLTKTALAAPFLVYCGGGGMVVARREGGGEGRVEEDEVLLFTSRIDL